MPKFTPEDVVRRYRETGAKPGYASANVAARDGKWAVADQRFRCCAMGVMVLGEPVTVDTGDSSAFARQLGVDFWAFCVGFDDGMADDGDHEDTRLGAACRQAVEREFGPIPYFTEE